MGKQAQEPSIASQSKASPKRRLSKKPKLVSLHRESLRSICRQRLDRFTRRSATPEPQGKDHCEVGLSQVLPLMTSEELTCPICLEIAVLPTLTDCGHLFCLHCAEDTFITDKACAVCRRLTQNYQFEESQTLKRLIQTYVSCLLELNDQADYKLR